MNYLKAQYTIKDRQIETLPEKLWSDLQDLYLKSTRLSHKSLENEKAYALDLVQKIQELDLGKETLITLIAQNIQNTNSIKDKRLQYAIINAAKLSKQTHDQLTIAQP